MTHDTDGATRRTVLRGLAGAAFASGMAGVASARADECSYTTSDLRIESWDGTELACTLFRPDEPGPHPSMLMTHGWGGDRSEAMGPALFASKGYVVLTYDSRGFGESGGEAGSDGPNEVKDTKRLISWLGEQSFVRTDRPVDGQPNPRVGMIGPSYAGGIQLNTAARDDRLDAIVPVIPWYDLKFSLEPNGVVKRGWGSLLFGIGVTGSRGATSGDGSPNEYDIRSGLDTNITQAFAEGVATNGFSENSDAFYRARSPGYKMDAIAASDTPTLTIEGWPDTLFIPNEGIWLHQDLRERGADSRLVLYDSGHVLGLVTNPESEHLQQQYAAALDRGVSFIEEHVRRGAPNRPSVGPTRGERVEWWEHVPDGEGRFTRHASIPPREAESEPFRLGDAAGAGDQSVVLNSVAPSSTSQLSPRDEDAAPGASAAQFDFTVQQPFEIAGTPTIDMTVRPLGAASHVFVKCAVVRDGTEQLVNNQAMPFRVEPALGGTATISDELVAFQRYLRKGDVLRVTVASTDAMFNESRSAAGFVVQHSDDTPATVTFPVVRGSTPEN
jgi:ABC-2 type transport system ATP-binding protein